MELVALLRAKVKECPYCQYLGRRHDPNCPLASHVDSATSDPARKSVDIGYSLVTKATQPAKQYTFGVLYKATNNPNRPLLDAHKDWATGDTLQSSQWAYVKKGDRRIWLQHKLRGAIVLGEWVDICVWPQEVSTSLSLPDGTTHKATVPANSVWMGVLWNSTGWQMVKAGEIRGFSLGGFTKRRRA